MTNFRIGKDLALLTLLLCFVAAAQVQRTLPEVEVKQLNGKSFDISTFQPK